MAGDTYYFALSTILVFGVILYITNLAYFRVKNKTLYGQNYKPGTFEHKSIAKLFSNRNLAITLVLTSVFVAMLVNSMSRILHRDSSNAQFVLISIPVFIALVSVLSFQKARNMFGGTTKHK